MRVAVVVGEHTVWKPANLVARTFPGLAEGLAFSVGMQSGVSLVDDEIIIDISRAEALVRRALIDWNQTGSSYRDMTRGVIGYLIVICWRAGVDVEVEDPLKAYCVQLDRHMK